MTHFLNIFKVANITLAVVLKMMTFQMPIISDWFGNAKKQFSNQMEFYIRSENVDGNNY